VLADAEAARRSLELRAPYFARRKDRLARICHGCESGSLKHSQRESAVRGIHQHYALIVNDSADTNRSDPGVAESLERFLSDAGNCPFVLQRLYENPHMFSVAQIESDALRKNEGQPSAA
jgi:hypothetical protein